MLNNILYGLKYLSPIGEMLIVSNETSLIGAWFYNQKYFKNKIEDYEIVFKSNTILDETKKWFDNYFLGLNPSPKNLKLDPIGTQFQKDVWNELLTIPYGKTVCYCEISDKIAKKYGILKMSNRAVGGAISKNPISIIIPCHRVIGKNNKLTGYAGGLDRKEFLLKLER